MPGLRKRPTATGYDKMAARWFSALQAVPGTIGNPGGTSPSPSQPPSPSPSQSTPAGGACTAVYAVTGEWPGGFQAEVTVTAGRAISHWTITWPDGSGQSINQSWSATVTKTGNTVTADNVAYNGTLAAGSSTRFGLLGSAPGAPAKPAVQCVGA